ncbi:hypothetical protein JXQ31_06145 [candidate division KSB1 bacterium]|nr:hypothetical protein [candidate division KSB1 bacterium]
MKSLNLKKYVFFVLYLQMICARLLPGQINTGSFEKYISGSSQFGYQYWKANDDQVQQFSIPMTFVLPVNDNLILNMTTSPAFSNLAAKEIYSLNGFSDTRISGSYLFNNEKVLVTFGTNIPSGKSALTQEEFSVASVLASHALNFRTPILGQGVDVSTGVAVVHEYADFVFGAGLGFLYRGQYEPFADFEYKYNPGNEFSFSGGVDYFIGRQNKLMFDISYTIFGNDFANDTRVFKAGNRLSIQAVACFEKEFTSFIFSLRDRIQGKNYIGSGELVPERQNSNGNELELTGMALLSLNRTTTVRGLLDGRIYSDNAYGVGSATIGGIGAGLSRNLLSRLNVDAECRFYFGSIHAGAENADLTGFQFTAGFRFYL